MLQLYIGVPDSLFLSAIDDLRYSAETLALLGVAGNPPLTDLASGAVAGDHGVLEVITVPPGTEPICQRRASNHPPGPVRCRRIDWPALSKWVTATAP